MDFNKANFKDSLFRRKVYLVLDSQAPSHNVDE